ncbi:hypothetical protein DPX16_23878 [Anabarilius grahami]|uniref:Uncharacterized protein n=1 Tax=Anabarilius grahami TaxID=495550 RepID=A0A3N0YY62_ANAGA|nr:hypothetical protein DPX16_23878 [Anabarilius grahami]
MDMDMYASGSDESENTRRKHKGKKTKIMKAMERGINMLIQHDKDGTAAEADQRLDKEHMAWERQFQQARLDLEKACLEFKMKSQEAEDRHARDTQQFKFCKCLDLQCHNMNLQLHFQNINIQFSSTIHLIFLLFLLETSESCSKIHQHQSFMINVCCLTKATTARAH